MSTVVSSNQLRCPTHPGQGCNPLPADNVVQTATVDCFGLTDIGKVRKQNEDQFLIADLVKSVAIQQSSLSDEEKGDLHGVAHAKLLLVADGVGGYSGGEWASSLAVEGAVQYLLNMMHWPFRQEQTREDQFLRDLKAALAWSQKGIQRAGESSPCHARMGTTLTLAYLVWPTVYLVHVGDSRAYVYRPPKLVQLTHDQTIAQMLADAGAIPADEVRHHHFRNVLGSLLCCDPGQLNPAVHVTRLTASDQLLLCTDGLTRYVPAAKIVETLASAPSSEHACRELIAAANAAGGSDNTTVVVARFSEPLAQGKACDVRHRGIREA